MEGIPAGLVHASEFREGLDWIGVDAPLTLAQLRGRVVILDFWTQGCINCLHIIPRLAELERRFPDVLSVVGVQAGKFPAERSTPRIAEACERLGVHHAVVNDRQFRVWHDYTVNAWPTVAVIDPAGYLVGIQPGEFPLEPMAAVIERLIDRATQDGTLRRGPDPARVTPPPAFDSVVRFPARAVLEAGELWVSDLGHERVLRCAWDARSRTASVLMAYDGLAEPRGLAALEGRMYVADRRGQTIVRLDQNGSSTVVAGTGMLAEYGMDAGRALEVSLRSPWGLSAVGGRLAVTMAGAHQLWSFDPGDGALTPLVGAGPEELVDGSFADSLLAQPTGIATVGAELVFADCESSAVRVADLAGATVRTLAGTGLFDFGDRDGAGEDALMEHVEDVAVHDAAIVAADTYNDRLKRIDPMTRWVQPWAGEAGEKGALRSPGGVWSDGQTLIVCDTGSHRLCVVESDGSLTEVTFT